MFSFFILINFNHYKTMGLFYVTFHIRQYHMKKYQMHMNIDFVIMIINSCIMVNQD